MRLLLNRYACRALFSAILSACGLLAQAQVTSTDGSFTAGGTTNLTLRTNGTTRATIDAAGNVGIGITSPADLLHVNGNARANQLNLMGGIVNTGSATTNMSFNINGTNRMTLLAASGNLGIGTAAPADLLHVNGNARANQLNLMGGIVNTGSATTNMSFNINGTNRMTLLAASGNLGIGTAAPADLLHVNGNARANQLNLMGGIVNTGSATTNMSFNINGTNRMTLLAASGNLGIGTAAPADLLHVNGNARANQVNLVNGVLNTAGATTNMGFNINGTNRMTLLASNGNLGIGTAAPADLLHVNGNVRGTQVNLTGGILNTIGATNMGFNINGTNRMTLLASNGNLGIGTAAPADLLHVNGNARANQLNLVNGTLSTVGATNLSLGTNGVTQITLLNTNGNVGIGTATPAYRLDVAGTINATGLLVNGQPVSGGTSQWATGTGNISYSGGNVGIGTATPSEALEIGGTGYLKVGGGRISLDGVAGYYGNGIRYESSQVRIYQSGSLGAAFGGGVTTLYGGGNAALTVDGNQNVGIGTSSPNAKLSFTDVTNTAAPDGITWYNPQPLLYGIYKTAGDWNAPDYQQLKLNWSTGIILDPGTSYGKSYVDVRGNGLRINEGVASPINSVGLLQLNYSSNQAFKGALIKNSNAGNYSYAELTMYNNIDQFGQLFFTGSNYSANAAVKPNAAGLYSGGSGGIAFLAGDASAPITFGTSNTNRVIIDPVGNVGIGTMTPNAAYKLDVAGTINATNILVNGQPLATGGTSPWVTGTGNISYAGGNVGIGTATPAANLILDIQSTTQGVTLPRMTTAQRDAITSSSAGMLIYNSSTNRYNFHNGTSWTQFASPLDSWTLGSGGTLSGVNTITSNAPSQMNYTGTFTTTANNQYYQQFGGSITARATASDNLSHTTINPTITAGANTQSLTAVHINPSFNTGAFTGVNTFPLVVGLSNTSLFSVRSDGEMMFGNPSDLNSLRVTTGGSDVFLTASGGNSLRFGHNVMTIFNPGSTDRAWVGNSGGVHALGLYSEGIATSTATQRSGYPQVSLVSMWNGSTAVTRSWVYRSSASTTANNESFFDIGYSSAGNSTIDGIRIRTSSAGTHLIGSVSDIPAPNTRVDIRGSNPSTGTALRVANSSNTELFNIRNDGNVGIGTTNPAHRLDVAGTINATSVLVNGQPVSVGAPQWATGTGNISYAAGNVGIGTTNPAHKLDVAGTINATSVLVNGQPVSVGAPQWATGTGNISYAAGNVGIGTTNPAHKLDVAGTINATSVLVNGQPVSVGGPQWATGTGNISYAAGNVGIGTSNPGSKLEVADGPGGEQLRISRGGGAVRFVQEIGLDNLYLYNKDASKLYMFWKQDGNVGIGTTNPQQKLHVNGTIYSTEVKVDVAAGQGPDYVFTDSYRLPSLEEVKAYISQHKHLPEVPAAKEMEANGVNLGEMNLLLLKKIEELTLHLIKQEERIKQLEEAKQSRK